MFEAFVKLNNAESISCSANWACSRTWVSKLVQNGDNPNIKVNFVAWSHGIWCNIRIAIHGLSKLGARQRSRDSHEHNQDVKGQRGYHLALAEESLDIINSSLHSIVTVSECSLRIDNSASTCRPVLIVLFYVEFLIVMENLHPNNNIQCSWLWKNRNLGYHSSHICLQIYVPHCWSVWQISSFVMSCFSLSKSTNIQRC